MSSRRKYTREYKREAAHLARSGAVPISRVARNLGINANMLARWCRELHGAARKALQSPRPPYEKMAALKRDLFRATLDRDF